MAKGKKKPSVEDIIKAYEQKQERLVAKTMRDIMTLFDSKVTELAFLYAQRRLISNRFLPKDIRDTIHSVSNTLNARVKDIIISSIRIAFSNSEEKNNIIDTQVAGSGRRIPPGKKLRTLPGALGPKKGTITSVDEYIKRKTKGLGLSKRIWKLSPSFKKTVNDVMITGLNEGLPARELAKKMRLSLRNNTYTENPGRGIYKSPQQNAMRVARSEINMAYANADYERWQLIDSIIGIEVRLSNSHPKYDICDEMKGRYPKDFHFIKWHPNCLCIAIPILASQEIRDQIMDYKLGLIDEPPKIPYVDTLPSKATDWMHRNADRVNGWKSKPYWIDANKRRIGKIFA